MKTKENHLKLCHTRWLSNEVCEMNMATILCQTSATIWWNWCFEQRYRESLLKLYQNSINCCQISVTLWRTSRVECGRHLVNSCRQSNDSLATLATLYRQHCVCTRSAALSLECQCVQQVQHGFAGPATPYWTSRYWIDPLSNMWENVLTLSPSLDVWPQFLNSSKPIWGMCRTWRSCHHDCRPVHLADMLSPKFTWPKFA